MLPRLRRKEVTESDAGFTPKNLSYKRENQATRPGDLRDHVMQIRIYSFISPLVYKPTPQDGWVKTAKTV